MKRGAPSGTEAPSGAGLSARTRHRCKTGEEVRIWKGAQDPKAGPGSSAKIAKNSSGSLLGNGDLIRREASGGSAGSPATRDACSPLHRERPEGGRRQGCLGGTLASSRPGGAPASRRTSSAGHRVLTRLRPKQESTGRSSTFSARGQRAKALFYLIG